MDWMEAFAFVGILGIAMWIAQIVAIADLCGILKCYGVIWLSGFMVMASVILLLPGLCLDLWSLFRVTTRQ
jgi:hypothetical protein